MEWIAICKRIEPFQKQGKHSARKPPKLIILQIYETNQNLQFSGQLSREIQDNWPSELELNYGNK